MALTIPGVFETLGGGVVDADVQCDATDITNISGGTRVAIVLPAAISGAANPVEAAMSWFLHTYIQAVENDDPEQAVAAVQRKSRVVERDKTEWTFTVKIEQSIAPIANTLAANADAYGET